MLDFAAYCMLMLSTVAATERLRSKGTPPRGSSAAVTAAAVQREFVRHLQQCHRLRAKLHDGGALCQVLTAVSQSSDRRHAVANAYVISSPSVQPTSVWR